MALGGYGGGDAGVIVRNVTVKRVRRSTQKGEGSKVLRAERGEERARIPRVNYGAAVIPVVFPRFRMRHQFIIHRVK